MATESVPHAHKPSVTVAELVAFTKQELEADADRQAKASAASDGELPRESHTGSTLDLSHKRMQSLPVEVITLIKDRVERLALSHNPRIALPLQLIQCDRLRFLNLRWNQLTNFPEAVLHLSKLEILDLSKNHIVTIPEEIKNMTSLKYLAVSRNQITRLPLALGDMASLSKLTFDDNPIQFPPPEALTPSTVNGSERDKDVCQLVKRYLRTAMRDRLRTTSSEELSEGNVETPRPPKRTATIGRFPVRPSISGIDNVDDLRVKSPGDIHPPPIPLKSHARGTSNTPNGARRPAHSPGSRTDSARDRSDTTSSSASVRSRRQGFVPRKTSDFGPATDLARHPTSYSKQLSNYNYSHSRESSTASSTNSYLAPLTSGEMPSGATSPGEGPVLRQGGPKRLSSLPENLDSSNSMDDLMKAAKRLCLLLQDLHRPFQVIAVVMRDGTHRRSALERQLESASGLVQELNRVISRQEQNINDVQSDRHTNDSVVAAALATLSAYGAIVVDLRQSSQRIVSVTDAFQVRTLLHQVYFTIIEARNICIVLGFDLRPPPKSTPRASSRGWNSRTTTPTQTQPINNRRLRGATILKSMNNNAQMRAVPPPVPVNLTGSRSNVTTSSTVSTRPMDSFHMSASNTTTPRINMIRSGVEESDGEDPFDKIFLKLRSACGIVAQSLPICRKEFLSRIESLNGDGQAGAAHLWSVVLTRCDAAVTTNNMLSHRLKAVKLKDPGLRYQKDFWQLCDAFVNTWTDFMVAMQELGRQRVELTTIKATLRPVQKMVKDVSKMISESSLYHQALRSGAPPPGTGLAPAFPASINTAYAQSYGHAGPMGYFTPLPATPLSAALGPAVHATVATTPQEYYHHGQSNHTTRTLHERVDTVMQPASQTRR